MPRHAIGAIVLGGVNRRGVVGGAAAIRVQQHLVPLSALLRLPALALS